MRAIAEAMSAMSLASTLANCPCWRVTSTSNSERLVCAEIALTKTVRSKRSGPDAEG
jgi:hypothetical protein